MAARFAARLARTPSSMYTHLIYVLSFLYVYTCLHTVNVEKYEENRAGGRSGRVCGLNVGVDITTTRRGGRRLVWWFSIPFSSRYYHPFRGGTISLKLHRATVIVHRHARKWFRNKSKVERRDGTFQSSLKGEKKEGNRNNS